MKIKPYVFRFLMFAGLVVCTVAFTSDAPMSQYTIPIAAWSVSAADLDLDGDMDIITGHNYASLTHWSGISITDNSGNGNFIFKDSLFFYGGQTILTGQLDSLPNPEIVFRKWQTNQQIGIIYNNIMSDTFFINVNSNNSLSEIILGDINNDDRVDIIFCSNAGRFWGVFYNLGYQNFTSSQHYSISDFSPLGIACGDLNNDGRDDVVICGQYVEVYFSSTSGFQNQVLDNQAFKDKVAICDFDLDGWKDIIADNGSVVNSVWTNIYQNTGNGNFTKLEDHFFTPGASDFTVTDFNNDGLPDIAYLLNYPFADPDTVGGIKIVYNLGDFQLSEPKHILLEFFFEGWRHFHSADFDGSGFNDFAIVRTLFVPLPNNLEILFNDGYGNFGPDPWVGIASITVNQQQLLCYPNPFQEHITFSYDIQKTAMVELVLFDLQGKLIKQVINQKQKGGHYSISWSGSLQDNAQHNTNVLVACLKVNGEMQKSIKLIQL